MNLKIKYLNKLKTEQILACFYTDHYETYEFGFIIDFNEDYLVIERFDNKGNYEGLTVYLQHTITRVKWEGNEIENITKLIDPSKRLLGKNSIDLTSIQTIIQSINKVESAFSFHIEDLDKDVFFFGQVHEIDEHSIVIHEFGTISSLDRRFILLSLDDITRIEVGGRYENNLRRLFS